MRCGAYVVLYVLKGTYYEKNHFYKAFKQLCGCSVWKQPAYTCKKIHQLIFL